ncbi:intraflagellar transport protein [Paraphysoderma sedebokerense]|nr:intraflagellar transport protein [Paraphysoderma sedebokerense]
MRTNLSWTDRILDKTNTRQPIYSLCFNPAGTHLLATAGHQILIYSVSDGNLLQTLKSHKDTVYAINFSQDGTKLASGGRDKTVIIWNQSYEGILKYSHNDSIQSVEFNPINGVLCSCTATDFGFWNSDAKSVTKHKVTSRILCSSWTNNGLYIAIGMFSGAVSIRNREGEEVTRIERNAPVWTLQWNPNPGKDSADILAVGDWNRRLSFYQLDGTQVNRDRVLENDPCCLSFFQGGEYLIVGGADCKVNLWTSDGIKIGTLAERESWIWSCRVKPKQNLIAVGSNDGTISVYQVLFNTVHGLYDDRYAYRENMTDVVIQHLSNHQRARIKCREYVKKIAVYKDKLAIQLPERIILYELQNTDSSDLHYRIKEKIQKKVDCNLLVVTSRNIILCLESKLQLLNFKGEREREWHLDALIRYIKVVGGPIGKEGLLLGLKNGQSLQIFINNPFPIPLIKQIHPIRCVDMNRTKQKLAVVDDNNTLFVYDAQTKDLIYEETNATSVAWNSENDDMLCYSGNGILSIKAGTFPSHQQKLQGFVVGFKGSKIFCLDSNAMTVVDVPQSTTLDRYLEIKNFHNAYHIACLGVTELDWKRLGVEALESFELDIAKKAFVRIRDLRYLEFLKHLEKAHQDKKAPDEMLGEIYAFQGRFHEAARTFKRAGNPQKAIDMYGALDMWENATQIATDTNTQVSEVLRKKAQMQRDRQDWASAAETCFQMGDYDQAIEILGSNGWHDKLIQVARSLNKSESKALSKCVEYFRASRHQEYAVEVLTKLGDISSLLSILTQNQEWEEAFRVANLHPEYQEIIYHPYANWCMMNDRFEEAQIYYRKAGRTEEALHVLQQFCENAVIEKRYNDAAYYYWMLSMENLEGIPKSKKTNELDSIELKRLQEFRQNYEIAELYYAYHSVFRFIQEPFTSQQPEILFNMCRFLIHSSSSNCMLPSEISIMYCLFALAKHCKNLRTFKTLRFAYEKLQQCRLPSEWQRIVDIGTLTVRAQPDTDSEDLLSICYSCSTTNPLINSNGDKCINCLEPFIRSFFSFESLPLVEFVPADGVSDDEAIKLIQTDPNSRKAFERGMFKTDGRDDLDEEESRIDKEDGEDLFIQQLTTITRTDGKFEPVKVDRKTLLSMNPEDVFIENWGYHCIGVRYFRLVVPDVMLTVCDGCKHFFHSEDFEFLIVQHGMCPFCRKKLQQ